MNELKVLISIIFPSFNGEPFLAQNLESIQKLANLNEIELIIIDNNSTDFSLRLIEAYKNKITIKLIKNKKNMGFAKACNIGVLNASGEFIFITNQDVIFPQNFFKSLLILYRKYKKDKEIIISPALIFNSNKIHYFGAKIHFLGFSYTPELGQALPENKMVKLTKRLSGATLFMKKKLFLDLGKFDPTFFMYCEDTDLSLRALRKGIPIYTTNITHLIHQKEEWVLSDFQYYLLERNRIFTFFKNIAEIKKLFPIFLLTELSLTFHSFMLKKFKIRVAIYRDLFCHLKKIKEMRKNSKKESELISYRLFSKTLDSILIGKFQSLPALRRFLNIFNFILKNI